MSENPGAGMSDLPPSPEFVALCESGAIVHRGEPPRFTVASEPIPLHERVDYWIEEAEQALNMVAWLGEVEGNVTLQKKAADLEEKVRWLIQHDHQAGR